MIRAITTGLGSGYLRPASGTWASAIAVAIGVGFYQSGLTYAVPVLAVIATILGFWAVPKAVAGQADQDPSEIVIDEYAGQWLAMSFTTIPLANHGVDLLAAWPGYVVPFLLFRLFDIWKPWLVGRADRRGDAFGVMADDLWAGLFAGIVSVILAGVYHALF